MIRLLARRVSDAGSPRPPNDVEHVAATVLRTGFILSGVVVGLGVVLQSVVGGGLAMTKAGGAAAAAAAGYPKGIAATAHGIQHGSGSSVVEVGLALLVATPVAAVVAAAIMYRRRGELRLAFVGAILVGILALTFVAGMAGI